MAKFLGVLFLLALLFMLIYSKTYIIIETKEGNELFRILWDKGTQFEISYLHSVNRSPVSEFFSIEGEKIFLSSSRFLSFGAGIASLPEDSGGSLQTQSNHLEYANIHREIPYLGIFVPREAQTTFHYQGQSISLSSLAPPGTLLHFRIQRKPLLKEILCQM
ncbi:MAG: DUF1850 domain-containing protein [Spirochaetales bacterium]